MERQREAVEVLEDLAADPRGDLSPDFRRHHRGLHPETPEEDRNDDHGSAREPEHALPFEAEDAAGLPGTRHRLEDDVEDPLDGPRLEGLQAHEREGEENGGDDALPLAPEG